MGIELEPRRSKKSLWSFAIAEKVHKKNPAFTAFQSRRWTDFDQSFKLPCTKSALFKLSCGNVNEFLPFGNEFQPFRDEFLPL